MKKIMFNDRYGLTEAVLSGRKTQTRRIVSEKLWDRWTDYDDFCNSVAVGSIPTTREYYDEKKFFLDNSPYKVGEVVAVAQSYKDAGYKPDKIWYRYVPQHDGYLKQYAKELKGWTNKMFVCAEAMPHQIRITNVRVERLQVISDEDCIKEGILRGRVGSEDTHFIDAYYVPNIPLEPHVLPQGACTALIDRISGKGTWESNPYVFVNDFVLVK